MVLEHRLDLQLKDLNFTMQRMPKMVQKQVWQKLLIFQNISPTGPTKTNNTVLPLSRYKYLLWANIFYYIICAYTAYTDDVWVFQLCAGHYQAMYGLINCFKMANTWSTSYHIVAKHSHYILITILCWTVTVPVEAMSVSCLAWCQKMVNGCNVPSPGCWINLNTTLTMQGKKRPFHYKRIQVFIWILINTMRTPFLSP